MTAPASTPGGGAAWHALEAALREHAVALDFFQVLRRIESLHRSKPRLGEAPRPAEEPIRLGQEPSLAFAPGTLAAYEPATSASRPRLLVSFLGLLGPNGPLPLHLTEYARDRLRNAADPTLARFLDVFHHRMLALFYRAWANSEPTVSADRPEADRFAKYVDALLGTAFRTPAQGSGVPAHVRRYYAGRFLGSARNAEGLRAIVADHLRVPAAIEELVGTWVDVPEHARWRLGSGPDAARLGRGTCAGARAWNRQSKFRLVLGPLSRGQFQRLLPEGPDLARLTALVRAYVGDELDWDVRLVLEDRADQPLRLGQGSRLGWNSWLGRGPSPGSAGRPQDVVLDPNAAAA